MTADTSPLGFTGERVLPGHPEWAWCFQAHKFGYDDLAARIAPGARVLDIGCGEGYGADLLARTAARVVACDYAADAVEHARARYARDNVDWVVCDAQRLPFKDRAFDVVSSLQVIEHFAGTDSHLSHVARVLRDGGWHYVATPNIDKMSDAERDNPYHLRDFTTSDLRDALARYFDDVELYGMYYDESSARVRQMHEAERREDQVRPKIARVERALTKLPGRIRTRLRPFARALAGIPRVTADEARNAILAEDFEARAPAEESFCLIGIARAPKR
jgi:ubiquinone/menaquinone biosynthesis C-methylase UbiE